MRLTLLKPIWITLCIALMVTLLAVPNYAQDDEQINLRFRNTNIGRVLDAISQLTGYQIRRPESMKGSVSIDMKNKSLTAVLDTIFNRQNYEYIIDGKTIFVYYKYDKKLYPFTFYLQHVKVDEVQTLVQNILKQEGETAAFSEKLNMVNVNATPTSLRNVSRLLKKLDRPPQQVLLRVKVLEVKKGRGDNDQASVFGLDWILKKSKNSSTYAEMNSSDLRSSKKGKGLYAQVIKEDLEVFLTAIEKVINFDLLASPWITAVNHQESQLLIGSKFGYKTTLTTAQGTQENVEFLEVGIKLKFTPHISENGYIRMVLSPSISEGKVTGGLPEENTTETHNEVIVKDDQTIIIAGLTKNSDSKIVTGLPILSHFPIVGGLFGKEELISERRNMMILITPTIITPEFLEKNSDQTILGNKVHDTSDINYIPVSTENSRAIPFPNQQRTPNPEPKPNTPTETPKELVK